MKAMLSWECDKEGINFVCMSDELSIPVEQWALYDVYVDGHRASLSPIISLLENEEATIRDDVFAVLPHDSISRLERNELKQLALPEPMPFNLSIEGLGLLTDKDFRFSYSLIHPDMRPVMGVIYNGSILKVADRKFILTEPFYSIIEGMKVFNSTPPESIEERFLAWAKLNELLPDDVVIGEHLKSVRVVRADAFTISPYINDKGEPDFDPLLLKFRQIEADLEILEDKVETYDALPKAPHDAFKNQFRKFSDAHLRYALSGGWYLVIPQPLRKILSVIHKIQRKSPEERKNFLLNPYVFFKEHPEYEIDENSLENLFIESSELSQRVKEIGIWSPPVLPYITPSKEPWLPPEELGLRVGDKFIRIDSQEIEKVVQKIENAIKNGKSSIKYNEQKIPANTNTLDALKRLISEVHPDRGKDTSNGTGNKKNEKQGPIALLIKGNLDELDYQAAKRPAVGKIGSWPGTIKTNPLPHQRKGFSWLQYHWTIGSRGALLADDMGLGKTLQALAFMAWIRSQIQGYKYEKRPMMIVAPTGLLKNWSDENSLHLQYEGLGSPVLAYGSSLKTLRNPKAGQQMELNRGFPVLNVNVLRKAVWVLTTYETLRNYQHSFGQIRWALIVFDEAQKIKNPSVLITDAAKAMNSDFVLTLTGTPIENRLADLWCIVDTSQPGKLGSLKEFSSYYEKNTEKYPHRLNDLKSFIAEKHPPVIMLRRMKDDHLDGLPDKNEITIEREMPEYQAHEYENAVLKARSVGRKRGQILKALHSLRSISLHPFLRTEETDNEYVANSARLAVTFELLDKIANKKNKALIFLESRQMQGILSEIIQRRYHMKSPPLIINGQVSGPRRKNRVDIFQERRGFDVMLLSPRAGGVGLTLTAANHVIHLSRWWNPAVEDQCTDRVYRIGQRKAVTVYYPLAIHPDLNEYSFDIRLHNLLEKKRTLCQSILAPPAGNYKDAENLFNETIGTEKKNNPDPFDIIDTMEPETFEIWILEQLSNNGYDVKRTPKSWDKGADGIAIAPCGGTKQSMIIQCKHTQTGKPINEKGILEIVKAKKFYSQSDQELHPVVVSNAKSFSAKSIQLAKDKGVKLVTRNDLFDWFKS